MTTNTFEPETILVSQLDQRFVERIGKDLTIHIVNADITAFWLGDTMTALCGIEIEVALISTQAYESRVCSECLAAKNKLNHSKNGA